MKQSILLVAGTRPNFMKIAPIRRALHTMEIPARLIHTGQHYDPIMSDVFFRDLGMTPPEVHLNSGGGTHAEQTASVVVGVEKELLDNRPLAVVVVGDVTGTFAAALAASKLEIPVIHVEAGLRSHDWRMPEEINRVLTDQLSDLLLIPSQDASENLLREGISAERIVFVGNVMIDSLHWALRSSTDVLARRAVGKGEYALLTLHRPANVDSRESFAELLDAVEAISHRVPAIFPIHPRTRGKAQHFGLAERLNSIPGLQCCEPFGYNDFVTLMANAKLVATDSGGIQEETTALGVPCLTMRQGTERPITVEQGTNCIVGMDPQRISQEVQAIVSGTGKKGSIPEGWDGKAGERVAQAIQKFLQGSPLPKTAGPRA